MGGQEGGGEQSPLPHPLVGFSLTFFFFKLNQISGACVFPNCCALLPFCFLPFCLGGCSRRCESIISYSAAVSMLVLGFQFPHVSLQVVSN